jgi:hypothetical protein
MRNISVCDHTSATSFPYQIGEDVLQIDVLNNFEISCDTITVEAMNVFC